MAAWRASALLLPPVCQRQTGAAAPPRAPRVGSGRRRVAGTGEQSKFFVQADYDAELACAAQTPTGPADKPWEQASTPKMVDTAKFKKDGPHSSASPTRR